MLAPAGCITACAVRCQALDGVFQPEGPLLHLLLELARALLCCAPSATGLPRWPVLLLILLQLLSDTIVGTMATAAYYIYYCTSHLSLHQRAVDV
jgi:hypothetical protein